MDEEICTQKQMDTMFGAPTASKLMLIVGDVMWVKREKQWHRVNSEPATRKDGRVKVTLR